MLPSMKLINMLEFVYLHPYFYLLYKLLTLENIGIIEKVMAQ